MRVLMVNKFLYPKGGSETYVFKLGNILKENKNEVQYFGMDNEKNIVGNSSEIYVSNQDFEKGILKNLFAPFKIVYSKEAARKIRKILNEFCPDVVHFNNIQFHLTPSIIEEVNKWRIEKNKECRIIYTAHDFQLVCPSHGLFDTEINICEKCLKGSYINCLKTKCVKGSLLKSLLGMLDAYYWTLNKAYHSIDSIICPSEFLKNKLETQERFKNKTIVLHNFVSEVEKKETVKEDYVLYFGKLCKEKGTITLLEACKKLPSIEFKFAGYGPAVESINGISNVDYVGFKTGKELEELIRKAKFSIYPSECYENCPFSVIESQMFSTPVIGSNIGGIPELVEEGKTGLLFRAGDVDNLVDNISSLYFNKNRLNEFIKNCKKISFENEMTYYEKLIKIYKGEH